MYIYKHLAHINLILATDRKFVCYRFAMIYAKLIKCVLNEYKVQLVYISVGRLFQRFTDLIK
jgi:hypothetical protein